jgi:molecular chaperone GrpE
MFWIFLKEEKIKNYLNTLGERLENLISERFAEALERASQTLRQGRRNQAAIESLFDGQNAILAALRRIESDSPRALALMDFAESFVIWRQNSPDTPEAGVLSSKLDSLLEQSGLSVTAGIGEPFDPSIHEACMARFDPDKQENAVLEIVRPGFVSSGKAVRFASVVVNRAEREGDAE